LFHYSNHSITTNIKYNRANLTICYVVYTYTCIHHPQKGILERICNWGLTFLQLVADFLMAFPNFNTNYGMLQYYQWIIIKEKYHHHRWWIDTYIHQNYNCILLGQMPTKQLTLKMQGENKLTFVLKTEFQLWNFLGKTTQVFTKWPPIYHRKKNQKNQNRKLLAITLQIKLFPIGGDPDIKSKQITITRIGFRHLRDI
jgi:hypothetical protein